MPADASIYGQQSPIKINTPFENLAQVLQLRNQQDAARGIAEQRASLAEERRQKTETARQEAAATAQFKALWSRTDPATGQPVMPTLEEAAPIIGAENAAKVFKGIAEVQKLQWENQQQAASGIAALIDGIEAWPAPDRQTPYATVRQGLIAKQLIKPGDMPETYNASWVAQKKREAMTAAQRIARDTPPADYTLGDQRMSGATNQPIATAAPKPEKVTYGQPQVQMVGSKRSLVRAGSDGRMYDMNLKPIDAAAIAPEPKDSGQAQEPLVAVIGPDNKPVLVRRSQAEGKTPASNREQGRPVTSGDANKIADFDTSLNDLKVLTDTLGKTGAGSKIGAMLPNVVTEVTGWGMDSKSRQGTIDRVKQVIGKALEGGVLRKEDEYKYEKILPTIGDPPPVAKAKLEGLQKALIQRRQTLIDDLGSANYDVSGFTATKPKDPLGIR